MDTIQTREQDGKTALFSIADAPSDGFEAKVDAVLDGSMPESEIVGVTKPLPILSALGMRDLPVSTTGDRLAKMHFDHGLTKAEIKALPGLLADPLLVFESDTQPGSMVFVLDVWKDGKPVVAAVRPDVLLKRAEVNLLASAYPKDRGAQIGQWLGKGLLRYANKEKTRVWAANGGVQFPWLVQLRLGSGKSVLGPGDIGRLHRRGICQGQRGRAGRRAQMGAGLPGGAEGRHCQSWIAADITRSARVREARSKSAAALDEIAFEVRTALAHQPRLPRGGISGNRLMAGTDQAIDDAGNAVVQLSVPPRLDDRQDLRRRNIVDPPVLGPVPLHRGPIAATGIAAVRLARIRHCISSRCAVEHQHF